jgi:hypothetical protein
MFTEEMISHYEDTRSNTFFSQLINLKHKGSVTEHIENFQRLNIKVTDIPDGHLIDVFIGTLKDNIQHEVRLWEPKSLENAFKVARNVESKNMAMATRRTYPNIYRENNAPSPKTHQPTRLTHQKLEERKAKGLCFNCDNKYSKGHKCGEKKLLYIDCEEEEEQEQEPSQDENVEAISSEELTPTISCNALAGISTPQTLKIEGYIKKKKVIVLIDSGSTHNFIHCKLAKDLNCFVYPLLIFTYFYLYYLYYLLLIFITYIYFIKRSPYGEDIVFCPKSQTGKKKGMNVQSVQSTWHIHTTDVAGPYS